MASAQGVTFAQYVREAAILRCAWEKGMTNGACMPGSKEALSDLRNTLRRFHDEVQGC